MAPARREISRRYYERHREQGVAAGRARRQRISAAARSGDPAAIRLMERQREGTRRWQEANREKARAASTAWKLANPDHVERGPRDRPLKRLHGLTRNEFDAKLAAQQGVCAICGNRPRKRRLHIDHDHRSGAIRDLLCSDCNLAVGQLRDDARRARAVAEYLEKHGRGGR